MPVAAPSRLSKPAASVSSVSSDGDIDDDDDLAPTKTKTTNAAPPPDREPLSWFLEHQARCESEFQSRRAELRALARERLRLLFRRQRGQELVWDGGAGEGGEGGESTDDEEEDDWSVGDTELSAWDSDVASLLDRGSLAESAAEEEAFDQPASVALRRVLLGCGVVAVCAVAAALRARSLALPFYGVFAARAWLPRAGVVPAVALLLAAWWTLSQGERRYSKRGLAAGHAALTVSVALGCGVMGLAWGAPAMLQPRLRAACLSAGGGGGAGGAGAISSASSSSCSARVDAYDSQLAQSTRLVLASALAVALAAACASACCVARCWELAHVAQRAAKHRTRRRRRQRQGKIPWHKLKVVGPVLACGGGGGGGGCPFAMRGGAAEAKKDV